MDVAGKQRPSGGAAVGIIDDFAARRGWDSGDVNLYGSVYTRVYIYISTSLSTRQLERGIGSGLISKSNPKTFT